MQRGARDHALPFSTPSNRAFLHPKPSPLKRMSVGRLHGEAGKEKEAKADAKELWKLLKGFKVSQGDGCLSAHDRGLAQQVAAGERALNPKSAADVSAKWAALQTCAAFYLLCAHKHP